VVSASFPSSSIPSLGPSFPKPPLTFAFLLAALLKAPIHPSQLLCVTDAFRCINGHQEFGQFPRVKVLRVAVGIFDAVQQLPRFLAGF
jgi:hypothetical protein